MERYILRRVGYTKNAEVPKTLWRIKGFNKCMKEDISMFTLILSKDDDSIVDEGLVGILDAYNTRHNTPSFRYVQALETIMRHQLTNFKNDKVFVYPS